MSRPKLPDYLLERLALGELPKDAARKAEEELAREGDGARRLQELRESDAQLLARHPPEAVASEIARRRRATAVKLGGRRMVAWLGVPAAALAAVVLALVLKPAPQGELILTKGDAALLVYAQRDGRSALLARGDPVRAGNVVQLAFRAPEGYGVILSLDGAGQVTLHLPARDGESVRLAGGKTTQR